MNDEQTGHTEQEAALRRRLAALPREIEPTHELWPAIHARIAPAAFSATGLRTAMLARAAGLVLPVLAALLAGAWIGYGYGARGAQAPLPVFPDQEVARIEAAFAGARESYLRAIALDGDRLDAPEREALRSQLAVIDQAVDELREAMAADPRNPFYIDSLQMTREREIELLADIRGATLTRL
jgi:hypothetical protein